MKTRTIPDEVYDAVLDALCECESYFDNRLPMTQGDINGDRPSEEMTLMLSLTKLIGEVERLPKLIKTGA